MFPRVCFFAPLLLPIAPFLNVDTSHRSLFRSCALHSGLVAQETLDDALAELEIQFPDGTEILDGQLAAKLVEMGCLNQWQAEQLLGGRTKFTLGGYQIIDSIGQGGMGQVFKAEHPLMGRIVAIKVLPHDKCTPEAVASFLREIRAQAQLDHENLVRAFDAGREKTTHFLVTEYVPGADLRKLVRKRGVLSEREAATIISQAAKGLAHAHQRGFVHRDVKPGNLLVTPEGKTKVSDLGLVGMMLSDEEEARSGKVVGTADYLSPEQILTPYDVAPVSDMYGLGCTLYYAVTSKVPHPGGTTRDKVRRHCDPDAIPLNPRRFNPHLSEDFIDVMEAMTKKDYRERIPTMEELVARLSPWAEDRIEGNFLAQSPLAPLTFIATPQHGVVNLKDTEPEFLDVGYQDPALQDSPSQRSQGTFPFAANQDTLRQVPVRPGEDSPDDEPTFSKPLVTLMSVAIGLLVLLLLAVIYFSIKKP